MSDEGWPPDRTPRMRPDAVPDWPEPPADLRRVVPPPPAPQGLSWLPSEPAAPAEEPQFVPPTAPDPRRLWMLSAMLLVLATVVSALGIVLYSRNDVQEPPSRGLSIPLVQTPVGQGTQAIAQAVDAGVVNINTELGLQNAAAAGTGVVITPSGEVLTNHHVIEGATKITATSVETGKTYDASVVGYDASHDIAVLQLKDAENMSTVTIGDSSKVSVGDEIIAIGNALGRGGTPAVATGVVTALNQAITATDQGSGSEDLTGLIQINALLQPGDSGGPLVNANAEVIGIDTAASGNFRFRRQGNGGGSAEGYAVPINQAMDIARQIESGKASTTVHIGETGFLGVSVADNIGTSGALLTEVVPGSPADDGGLAAGDAIVSIDGMAVDSASGLLDLIHLHGPGESIKVQWLDQSGATHSADIKLTTGPVG